MSSATSTVKASSEEASALAAMGRGLAYAHLALGFAHPGERLMRLVREPADLPGGGVGRRLRALRETADSAGLAALRSAYMRVFDPRRDPILLEAEHRTNHFQQRTELLADLMGFYRAFAVMPDNERPDHLSCELDFLHVLCLKESRAWRGGREEQAEVCAAARRTFLEEHLLAWWSAACRATRERAQPETDRFYLLLADGLEAVLRSEKGRRP